MKMVVVYKSFLGSTKKYAFWIAEKYHADLFKFNDVSDSLLNQYDLIVVASGTYATHMPLINFLKKHWKILTKKKIVVVAVGLAPAEDLESLKSYELIPEEIQSKIHYFKVKGQILHSEPGEEPSIANLHDMFHVINGLIKHKIN